MASLIHQVGRLHKSHRFRRLLKGVSPLELGRAFTDQLSARSMIVVVGSAHKVGSTWLDHMIEDLIQPRYDFEGWLTPSSLRALGNSVDFSSSDANSYLNRLRGVWQFKTHHDLHDSTRSKLQVITVHRDLRDMIISTVHFCTSLPHTQGGYAPDIKAMPLVDRISHELRRAYNLDRAEYWWRLKDDLKLKYEEIKSQPTVVMEQVASFLDVQTDAQTRQAIIDRHDFKRKSGRKVGEENTNSFLRKGIVGDWKQNFAPEHIEQFKSGLQGRWNRLLVEMGYETHADW